MNCANRRTGPLNRISKEKSRLPLEPAAFRKNRLAQRLGLVRSHVVFYSLHVTLYERFSHQGSYFMIDTSRIAGLLFAR
jgi:hypothetical protein